MNNLLTEKEYQKALAILGLKKLCSDIEIGESKFLSIETKKIVIKNTKSTQKYISLDCNIFNNKELAVAIIWLQSISGWQINETG